MNSKIDLQDPTLPPIGVTSFNRPRLLRISLDSLVASIHGPITIYDDCSYDNESKKLIEPYDVSKPVGNIGCCPNRIRACDDMAKRSECFFITDSDFVYRSGAFIESYNLYRKYRQQFKLAMVAVFRNHSDDVCNFLEDCVIPPDVTGCVLIDSEFYKMVAPEIGQSPYCDCELWVRAFKYGYRILSLTISGAEHIGVCDGIHMQYPAKSVNFPEGEWLSELTAEERKFLCRQ